jgi:hypothetical protein
MLMLKNVRQEFLLGIQWGKKSDINYKIKKSYHFGQYLLAHFNPFYKNNICLHHPYMKFHKESRLKIKVKTFGC